jgi:hypothetical protein
MAGQVRGGLGRSTAAAARTAAEEKRLRERVNALKAAKGCRL